MKLQDKKAEIEFFDQFDRSGGYDVFDETGYQKMISWMTGLIPPKRDTVIFDMGCGSGAFTSYLYKAYPGSKIVGVDISPGCIKRAKRDFPKIEFMAGDIEETGLRASSVDVVCYSGILHHFPDFRKVAKEAYRILKPGGFFFSYDPHLYNPPFWLYRAKSSPFYSPVGITTNERLLTAKEVDKTFSREGFETKIQIRSGVPFCYIESKKIRPLLVLYNFFDGILSVTPLSKMIGAWVIGFGVKK